MKFKKRRRQLTWISLFILIVLLPSAIYLLRTAGSAKADSFMKFDEGGGSAIHDSEGKLAGTITGAIWVSESCADGKCLFFDGTGDYINFTDDADVDFAAATNFTIELWFRSPDITSGTRVLVAKYLSSTSTDGGYKIYLSSDGKLNFGVDDDNTWNPDDLATSAAAYDDNRWHHLVVTKTGTTSIKLYVDGHMVGEDTSIQSTNTLVNTDALYIGIDGDGSSNGFVGYLDEVKIYTAAARTQAQINTDYQKASDLTGTAVSFGPDTYALSHGLVGYWKLDEASGNPVDSSGNSYTLTNNGTTTFVTAKYGKGSEHVPASNQYLSTASTIPGIQTVSLWVNPDSNTNYYWSLTSTAYLTSSSGTLSAAGVTGAVIYVNGRQSSTISANTWSHVVVTFTAPVDASQLYLGRQSTNYFDGTLDEIKLFNRVFTPSEVNQLYQLAPAPIGEWKLDENTGSTAYDTSGNANHGAFNGNTAWVPGKFGSAADFDGTNDYVLIPHSSSLNFGATTDSYTVSGWIYTRNKAASPHFIEKGGYGWGTGQVPINIEYNNSLSILTCSISDGSTIAYTGDTNIDNNRWYHVACVRDVATDTLRLYMDGVLVDEDTDTVTNTVQRTDIGFAFGIRPTGLDGDLNGKVDNVRVYNYVRSQSQVVEDMNGGHPTPGSPVGSISGFWKLDEGYGSTAYDASPYAQNLTLQNSPTWTNNGKFGKALDFESTSSQYLSANDSNPLSLTSDMTLSVWVKPESVTAATEFPLAGKWDSSYNDYLLAQYGDEVRFYVGSGSNYITTNTANLATGSWYHLLATYQASTQTAYIYVDGKLQPSTTTGTIPSSVSDTTSQFTIGARKGPGVSEQIAANADDGLELVGVQWYASGDGSSTAFGVNSNLSVHAGLRFQTVNIPQGSTINTATLQVYGTAAVGTVTNVHAKIVGDDADNAAAWRSGDGACGTNNCPSTLSSVTTAQVDWDPSSWSTSGWNTSPDISSVISEIVGRAGWSANNNLRLAIRNDSSTTPTNNLGFNDCAYSTCARPARLEITYGAATLYYDGIIDEVKVFPSFFTPEQVKVEYNHGSAQSLGSVSTSSTRVPDNSATAAYCVPGDSTSCNPPIGEWKLDENTGSTAYDTSGNGYSAALSNVTSTNWIPGKAGSGLYFNGSNVYGTISTSFPGLGSAFTISGWVNFNSMANYGSIISRYNWTNSDWLVGTNGTTIDCSITYTGNEVDRIYAVAPAIPALGTWHHFACVKTTTTLTMYMDGVAGTPTATSGTLNHNPTINPMIGERMSTGYYPLNGRADDIKIYNYARTPAQIIWEYNRGAPVAHYKLDECTGNTAYNSALNSNGTAMGNNLTITIGATGDYTSAGTCGSGTSTHAWNAGTTGRFNGSIGLDDTNDYLSVTDSGTSIFDLTTGLSLSAWVKTDANEADNVIISKGASYEMGINGDGDVYWDGSGAQVDDGRAKVLYGTWHHVLITNNDTTTTYYVDGVMTGTSTAGIDADNNTAFQVGYDGTNYFDGQIDDVRIYNYVLTSEQVRNVYNSAATVQLGR